MMTCQDYGRTLDRLPDNVVAFPRPYRGGPAASRPVDETCRPAPHRGRRPVAISGAELNARLLILFAICTTSAAIAVSAVRVLQG